MRSSNITINAGQLQELKQVGRKMRRPQHSFNLVTRPFGIYPFMIAPVLAGETLKSALMQSRVVTDPIADRHIGWWKEYYWFYVKLSDLDDRDVITQALINPGSNMTTIDAEAAVSVHNFYAASGVPYVNYVEKALKRITEEFFRDEGETWNTHAAETGIPMAQYQAPGLWRSLTPAASAALDFMDVSISTATDNAFTVSELQDAYQQYEILRMGGFVAMSWDDYIAAQGVRVPEAEREEQHVPELLRFARSWQYPIAAIDPTDGSAAAAVQWSIAERIDKDRFFREPGFIVGVTVCRPKVYLDYKGFGAQVLSDAYRWLPQVLDDDPTTSLLNIADNTFAGFNWTDAGGVYVDLKDLLLYGDQFVNMASADLPNKVTMDLVNALAKYPTTGNIDDFFVAESPSAANARVREDGVCTLNILSRPYVATDTSRGVMSSQPQG